MVRGKGGLKVAEKQSDLQDRVVVVTGAARGMGRAYAEGFLEAGAKVVTADKSWTGVDDFRQGLDANGNALVVEMDVTDDIQIGKAYQAAMERFGAIDVLVNNAAMLQMTLYPPTGRLTTLETRDEDWLRMFNVNVIGALKVTRQFIRPMIEKQRGSIINVVSSGILNFSRGGGYAALRPGSREMPYMATKAALATMSFYLAEEEAKQYNISVNLIIPGHTRGSWFDDTVRARIAAGMRAGQKPVAPAHVVPLALFLASQDGKGVTGKMFDALEWNREHGLGGYETWADSSLPPDIERALSTNATA